MKARIQSLVSFALLSAGAPAAIIVPGANGTDGPLNITANTVIDLSLAPTGVWDSDNTANAGQGVYDPEKWAVVFKYSSVNVAAGATITFKNNASRAPVVWLVSGNVTIDGTVSLDGQNSVFAPLIAEPGPGGFRGGQGYYSSGVIEGAGFGVGGSGSFPKVTYGRVGSASYGSQGLLGPSAYGNPSLIPLIGGSGGAGSGQFDVNSGAPPFGGGGGGGAILIACSNQFSVNGTIRSNGGNSNSDGGLTGSGAGSGGGIRIVSGDLLGAGIIEAKGGWAPSLPTGLGRIRIERVVNSNISIPVPDPSVVDLAENSTALIWPPTGAPEVKIISAGGNDPSNLVPDDPKAGFGTIGADVALPSANNTTVIVETTNVEAASVVKVRATPRSNANFSEVNATLESTVSTDPLVIRWTATLPVGTGYNAVQARVIRP